MRKSILRVGAAVVGSFVGISVLFWAGPSSAQLQTLGPDCGTGATIVGTSEGGKVTLGTDSDGTCTVMFSSAQQNAPACTAVNETNAGGNRHPGPIGTRTTTTTLVLDGLASNSAALNDEDVVSFFCKGY